MKGGLSENHLHSGCKLTQGAAGLCCWAVRGARVLGGIRSNGKGGSQAQRLEGAGKLASSLPLMEK